MQILTSPPVKNLKVKYAEVRLQAYIELTEDDIERLNWNGRIWDKRERPYYLTKGGLFSIIIMLVFLVL